MSGAAARDRWRNAKRRIARKLADRRTRRHVLLVLLTLLAVGTLAAIKGLIGYYVFARGATRVEVALIVAALVAAVFALGERKVAAALEARFNRNTRKHREALAALRDELAEVAERPTLEQRLVSRFDELFATRGTVLFVDDGARYAVVASSRDGAAPLPYDDPLVVAMRERHATVVPAERGSTLAAPIAWPLRTRGHLIGILAAGEHDYLESFDATEIEAVEAVADAAAANLALLDSSLTAHLVHTRNNLPPALATFVGRERELAECRAAIGHSRLVTLTGFGGAGKTCLARRLAEEALLTHRDGVWWVDLAGVSDDAHVASALAAAIGVDPHAAGGDLAHRIGDEQAMIVLDTCEHVRAGCAALGAELLRTCPRLSLLATSQSPIGIAGERDYAIPPLAIPEDDDDAQALAQCDAVRLFVERAQAAAPGFVPGDADMEHIVAIVRQLDGIPLAIELAAARMRLMSLAAIREHLTESLRLLAGGDRAQTRHETMRASLAWCYDPLGEGEQRLLRRLSVFRHGFTLDAAAHVAAEGSDALDVLDPIGRLVEASLVMVARRGDEDPRYQLPETLRQFAGERLAQDGDAPQVRARHAKYYAELALREGRALHRRDRAAALARLDRESANLQAAHDFLVSSAQGGDDALALAHALAPHFRDRGLLARGIAQLGEALAHSSAPTPLRAEVLLDIAHLLQDEGNHEAARAELAKARDIAPRPVACRIGGRDALSLAALGQFAQARERIDEVVIAARALGDAVALQEVLDDASELYARLGDSDAAAALADESLALARGGDDAEALHVALRDAARAALARHDRPRARALLGEAVGLALADRSAVEGEDDLLLAAAVAEEESDWARAARYAGAAQAAAARIGNAATARHDLRAARAGLGAVLCAVAFEAGHRLKLATALQDVRTWLA